LGLVKVKTSFWKVDADSRLPPQPRDGKPFSFDRAVSVRRCLVVVLSDRTQNVDQTSPRFVQRLLFEMPVQ
jgi:hypothetical protein